jgi:hypothetical protein
MEIQFNWTVPLLFLVFQPYSFDRNPELFSVMWQEGWMLEQLN